MKRGAFVTVNSPGFTIVETMIVLGVTGLLFVAIATTWFGRQHKTEFQTAAQEMRSRIQQVVSDVQNGYFPDQNNFTCTGGPSFSVGGTGTPQGANYPCVFLGKVIQLHAANGIPEPYSVYTVAADGSQTTLYAAKPVVLAPSSIITNPGFRANTEVGTLDNGLSLQAYKIGANVYRLPTKDIAVGFLSTLGTQDANGAYNSGIPQIDTYAIPESSVPTSSTDAANKINAVLRSSPAAPTYYKNQPLQLCFQSGDANQFAIIGVGTSGSQLTADITFKNGKCSSSTDFH